MQIVYANSWINSVKDTLSKRKQLLNVMNYIIFARKKGSERKFMKENWSIQSVLALYVVIE